MKKPWVVEKTGWIVSKLSLKAYKNHTISGIMHETVFFFRKKMGGEEFAGKYRDQLLHELQDSYVQFKVNLEAF